MILELGEVFGGTEQKIAALLRHVDRSRIPEIVLVAPEALRPLLPPTYTVYVSTDRLELGGSFFLDSSKLRADAASLACIMEHVAPDVAFGVGPYASALVALGVHLTSRSIRSVASFVGLYHYHLRHFEKDARRSEWAVALLTGTTLLADTVIVPSQGIKNELREYFRADEGQVKVIPNGVSERAAREAASQPVEVLSRFGNRELILCAVARLSPEKDQQLLLEAFRIVRSRVQATLLIIGIGPEYGALRYEVRSFGLERHVLFLGFQTNCYPYMKRADLFIHTCLHEGFGYSILEAMAVGTPVVSTDCPCGPRELLGESQYGVLVPSRDPAALAEAILVLANNQDLRRTLGIRGVIRARAFSIERMILGYQSAFEEAVNG